MAGRKNTIEVGGTGNTVQVGHVGDVNINEAPAPDLRVVSNETRADADGHTRVIRLQVVSPYTPGRLLLEADADGVVGGDIHPVDSGQIQFGSNQEPNRYFVSIERPSGRYDLVVKTARQTPVRLTYAFQ